MHVTEYFYWLRSHAWIKVSWSESVKFDSVFHACALKKSYVYFGVKIKWGRFLNASRFLDAQIKIAILALCQSCCMCILSIDDSLYSTFVLFCEFPPTTFLAQGTVQNLLESNPRTCALLPVDWAFTCVAEWPSASAWLTGAYTLSS